MSEWVQDEIVIKKPRRWVKVIVILLLMAACVVGLWFLRAHILSMQPSRLGVVAEHVRSDVTGVGDSLDVVVSWGFTDSARGPQPDSARLEVGVEGADPRVSILPAKQLSDTVRIAGPPVGGTAMGHSCVSGVHGSRLSLESCTPWQFVRPGVQTPPDGQASARYGEEGGYGQEGCGRSLRVGKRRSCSVWSSAQPGSRSIPTWGASAPPGSATIPASRSGSRSTRRRCRMHGAQREAGRGSVLRLRRAPGWEAGEDGELHQQSVLR